MLSVDTGLLLPPQVDKTTPDMLADRLQNLPVFTDFEDVQQLYPLRWN